MRYLAIDPGQARTGLAVGDGDSGHAGPVGMILTPDERSLLAGVAEAVEEHGPDALVIGVPLNMDGTVGAGAKRSMALAERLEARFGLPVHCVDERLSSHEARSLLAGSGLTHKQKQRRRDAIAAAAILRTFFAGSEIDRKDLR